MKLPRLQILYLVLFGLTMGFCVFEIGLRLAGISFPVIVQLDPIRGTSLRPNVEVLWIMEGNSTVKINSDGLHDSEHLKIKPDNTFRIAVLGDSQVEARQVPIEDNFVSILEKNLESCKALGGKQVETLNFGVSDYGTAQELLTLKHFVWDYSPDMIILGFLVANDIRNNSRELDGANYRPYFVYEQNELILDNSFLESSRYILRNAGIFKLAHDFLFYSRVFQLIKEGRDAIYQNRAGQIYKIPNENRLEFLVYHEPADEKWKEAWRVTEGLLLKMRAEVKTNGAQFLVVGMPWGEIEVNPDTKIRQRYMDHFGLKELFYPYRRIKKLGTKEGFPVLPLAPHFQSYVEENQTYLHGFKGTKGRKDSLGFGHWNKKGHRLAGNIVSAHICKNFF